MAERAHVNDHFLYTLHDGMSRVGHIRGVNPSGSPLTLGIEGTLLPGGKLKQLRYTTTVPASDTHLHIYRPG